MGKTHWGYSTDRRVSLQTTGQADLLEKRVSDVQIRTTRRHSVDSIIVHLKRSAPMNAVMTGLVIHGALTVCKIVYILLKQFELKYILYVYR